MSKSLAAAVLATLSLVAASSVMAEETPWLVRVRAVHLDTADKSDPVGGVGASDRLTVSNKTIPEFDVSYFFSPNLAAELVLTYPQKHDVSLDGTKIGTFKHLPPTLLLQYHFVNSTQFKPYLGAGVNYTTMSKVDLLGGKGGLEHDSFGLALQAGVDYAIDKKWSLNFDVKKVQIRSDVFISGAKVSRVKVDPLMVGVGVGYRF
ncbi:OmpW family protein [Duganella sp. BJB488]|uniref:OmpW/AlkL family protein n=1 Tax=unclassified Duganella TaxID=2636909 RepID=UPI000E34FDEB|nr:MULTISPECIES: OmpW family outer membrane protein [unclassified Duganella]RFP09082.1 OmpW family protein [Duganella sp. BJB489]RFP12513.1 OmpW family protein [Duganella sp. BJB488]RFP29082.1 OmpW family protein [Duganella sp. BJB480]